MVGRINSVWSSLFLLLLIGCGESTIRVVIYGDYEFSEIRIKVHRGESLKHDDSSFDVQLPNSLLLENGETDSSEKILVTVEGRNGYGVDVTRKARLDFDPDRDVLLPMPLCSLCEGGDKCGDDKQTCVKGNCQSYDVKAENLAEDDGRDSWDTSECSGGSGGNGGSGGSGGTTCTGKCNSGPNCGTCPNQDLSINYLRTTKGGFSFYIDAGEVNQKQYGVWLATNPKPAEVHADCDGATLAPSDSCLSDLSVCKGDCEFHPQVCVSWCAAEAYCRWAGKRLCAADYQQLGVNEWEVACWGATKSGLPYGEHYPYGEGYQAAYCNGKDSALGTTVKTRSLSQCQGAFPDLRDMSGNVSEWTADKEYRGGHFDSPSNQMHCSSRFSGAPGHLAPTIGFRCCSDP